MKTTDDNFITGAIVALVTPFRADNTLDLDAWVALIDWHLQSGTNGIVVGGTTGESATLSPVERDQLLELAIERVAGKIPVLAGTGSASTAQTIADSQRAAGLGADAVLVVAPYYNRPPQRGLIAHYRAIADASPVPVVLYNVPSRTVTDIHPDTTIVLNQHSNIIAIKEAVADMDRLHKLIAAGVPVISGDDPSAMQAMRLGAVGVISVASNVAPQAMASLCQAIQAGNQAKAEIIQRELEPVFAFLSVETNPIPAKWLLAQMGFIQHGLRLPLVSLEAEHHGLGEQVMSSLRTSLTDRLLSADQRTSGS